MGLSVASSRGELPGELSEKERWRLSFLLSLVDWLLPLDEPLDGREGVRWSSSGGTSGCGSSTRGETDFLVSFRGEGFLGPSRGEVAVLPLPEPSWGEVEEALGPRSRGDLVFLWRVFL